MELKKVNEECMSCGQCAEVCPNNCISILKDGAGYGVYVKDTKSCSHCNACTDICPAI